MFTRGFSRPFVLLLSAEPAEGATPTVVVSTDPPEPKPTESATGSAATQSGKGGKEVDGGKKDKPETKPTESAESPEKKFSQADVDRIVKERIEREKSKATEAEAKVRREAEERALKEQGDWKKLAEQREADLKAKDDGLTKAQADLRQTRLTHAAELAAYGLDFNDPDDAKLADFSGVTFDENGQPDRAAVKAALEKLLEAKPHFKLKEEPTKPRPTGTPGGSVRPTLPANKNAQNADAARRRNVL